MTSSRQQCPCSYRSLSQLYQVLSDTVRQISSQESQTTTPNKEFQKIVYKKQNKNLSSTSHTNRCRNNSIERRYVCSKSFLYIYNEQTTSSSKKSSFDDGGSSTHSKGKMGFGIKDLKEEDKLTSEQATEYGKIFAAHDKDKSGSIDVKELGAVLTKCGFKLSSEGLDLIMSLADFDGSHTIHEKEFKFFLGRCVKLRTQFESNATNGNLDINALNKVLNGLGYKFTVPQTQTLFKLLDRDSSGLMSLEEFLQLGVFLRFCKLQFILADTDGSGQITLKELEAHLPPLGLNEIPSEMVQAVFKQTDASKDGMLNFEAISFIFILSLFCN